MNSIAMPYWCALSRSVKDPLILEQTKEDSSYFYYQRAPADSEFHVELSLSEGRQWSWLSRVAINYYDPILILHAWHIACYDNQISPFLMAAQATARRHHGSSKVHQSSESFFLRGQLLHLGEATMSSTTDDDDHRLVALGYKPSFRREFSNLATISFAFSIMVCSVHSIAPILSQI